MSKSYELQGTITKIEEAKEVGSKGFTVRDFVVTVPSENLKHEDLIALQFHNEDVSKLDEIREGDEVKVQFNLHGKEWKDRVFNNLVAWRIDVLKESSRPKQEPPAPEADEPEDDDFPF